jgi:YidC/Oxa1 family membrane protein insertase
MEVITLVFNTFFFGPIVNLLILFYKLLSGIGIPGALGLSIMALTIIIRLLTWPLMTSQLKSASKMNSLKPLLDELKGKHKGDKAALQKAQMELYKEHGVNPAGGCLPTLIQFPVLIALYQAIINVFPSQSGGKLEHINNVLYNPWLHLDQAPDPNFFGLNLAMKPSDLGILSLLLLVPLLTAGLTFVQSKMMTPVKVKKYKNDSPKEKKEKDSMEDTMAGVQSQMTYLMPIMIGYFAFQFPIGLAIYWNTITILGIIQQYMIGGWGGLSPIVEIVQSRLVNKK